MTIFFLIIALILAILAVVIALENPLLVTMSFFGYGVQGSLAAFVLLGVGVGIVIGILIMLPSVLKGAINVSRHRKQIRTLEKTISEQKKPMIEAVPEEPTSDEEAPEQKQ